MIHRVCAAVLISAVSASAQWINHPTPGIPRTPDGKPNFNAPVPKTADGKPDLTGLWQRMRNPNQRTTLLAMGPNLEDFMRPGERFRPCSPLPKRCTSNGWRISWRIGRQHVVCLTAFPTRC